MRCSSFSSLILVAAVAGCSVTSADPTQHCETTCGPGEVCDPGTGQCMPQSRALPALEVQPPSGNTQGWVLQEFQKPTLDAAQKINLQLRPAVSMEGGVYASHDQTQIVPAQVIAWRDSELEGRPRVQVEAATGAGKRDNQKHTFELWLNQGHTYTFFIKPLPPYDTEYPPLLVPPMKITDHVKHDFILDGTDRAVEVTGHVVDSVGASLGKTLAAMNLVNEKGVKLSASVRIRALETDGERRSTIGTTGADDGTFAFKVPSGVSAYTLRIESAGVVAHQSASQGGDPSEEGLPIPTMECSKIVLGLSSQTNLDGQPTQEIDPIKLPPFLVPRLYTLSVRGKDDVPVKGAAVTFSTEVAVPDTLNASYSKCTATYSRTGYSDKDGKVRLLLMPGGQKGNQEYQVTVVSPNTSEHASQWIQKFEVGMTPGTLQAIELERRYELSGQVTREDTGSAVEGLTIDARGVTSGASTAMVPSTAATATTDKDGAYKLFVDPGIYNLDLRPPQGLGLPSIGLTAKIDTDVLGKQFILPSPKVLLGQVLDPKGTPLPYAQVHMFELVPETEKPLTKKAALRASSVTDVDGLFGLLVANGNK